MKKFKYHEGHRIYRDELTAKMTLARLVWAGRDEKRVFPCGDHFHITSQDKKVAA